MSESGNATHGNRSVRIISQQTSGSDLSWEREGADWPNRTASRFVEVGALRWHVQVMGQGPVMLLVHGTGASTHSWRDLAPLLARHFTVIAPDLPGHAFTSSAPMNRMSLPGMASALADLLQVLGMKPEIAVGHSAGAAILVRMCLDKAIAPAGLISLNGAMLPLGGISGQIFSPLARLLASSSIGPRLFARWASDKDVVERLLGQTGSNVDPIGLALYGRLARSPNHAAAVLSMMANWDLGGLERQLPQLRVPLHLVVGSRDGSIPPADAALIRRLVAGSRIEILRGLGHLAHEERPQQVAGLIERQSKQWCVLPEAHTPEAGAFSS